ncbi:MAG TPA: hypothetical protein VEK82_06390 [Stellaceae bacterium]|nr:hypothetical protein [Stellaceae bacterium]
MATTIGKNISADVAQKNGKRILTLEIDLDQNFGLSSSGKSIIIASSEGNIEAPGAPGVKIGLNIYRKA